MREKVQRGLERLPGAQAMLWVQLISPKHSELPVGLEWWFQPETRKTTRFGSCCDSKIELSEGKEY